MSKFKQKVLTKNDAFKPDLRKLYCFKNFIFLRNKNIFVGVCRAQNYTCIVYISFKAARTRHGKLFLYLIFYFSEYIFKYFPFKSCRVGNWRKSTFIFIFIFHSSFLVLRWTIIYYFILQCIQHRNCFKINPPIPYSKPLLRCVPPLSLTLF